MKKVIRFLSKDKKTCIYAVEYRNPAVTKPRAVVQLTHGMSEHIGWYDSFARRLAEAGFIVAGHDHLGHGHTAPAREDLGYFAKDPDLILVKDMHQLRMNMTKKYPDLPYIMLGHSMGSYLLREYLAHYGEGLTGAIIMGTGYVKPLMASTGILVTKGMAAVLGKHHRSLLVQMLMFNKSYRSYSAMMIAPERNWLSKDLEFFKAFIADPYCGFLFTLNGFCGLFQAVRAACLPKNVDRIPKDLPLLLISGKEDPVGDLGEGVRKVNHLYKAAGIKDVTMKLYPGDRHEILNESDHDKVEEDIIKWINGVLVKYG